MAKKKNCFVISPIGDEESEVRKRSDQILKHIIEPSVGECGYRAIRADKIDKPGVITSQVIQHVVEDPLVIADLTGHNPNVFYELAIRHAIRKPFIQIIQKGERIPFDVAGTRTINVNHRDLDSAGEAKDEIVNQIKSLEQDDSNIETPISVSLDLQILRQSSDPEHRSLADIMSALSELSSRIEEKLFERTESVRRKKFRHFHPKMFEKIMFMSGENDPIGVLIAASLIRDELPWLYEICLETYRTIKSGTQKDIRDLMRTLDHVTEVMMHSSFSEEFISSREAHMMVHEFPRMLQHMLERSIDTKRITSRRKAANPRG